MDNFCIALFFIRNQLTALGIFISFQRKLKMISEDTFFSLNNTFNEFTLKSTFV